MQQTFINQFINSFYERISTIFFFYFFFVLSNKVAIMQGIFENANE